MNAFNYAATKGKQAIDELKEADKQIESLNIQMEACQYRVEELFGSNDLLIEALAEKDSVIMSKNEIIALQEKKERRKKILIILERIGWATLLGLTIVANN